MSAAAAMIYFLSQAVLLGLNNLKGISDTSGYLFHIVHYFPLSHLGSFVLGIAGGCFVVVHGNTSTNHRNDTSGLVFHRNPNHHLKAFCGQSRVTFASFQDIQARYVGYQLAMLE
jgi:hypothetical protein